MKRLLFVITIDTEADHQAQPLWVKSDPLTLHSITEGIPARLQPLLEQFGARATYLLTAEVLEDEASVHSLKAIGSCELGTHLHGDNVSPNKRIEQVAGTRNSDLACYYRDDLEYAKLSTLTNLFTERIGYAPLSYRAGIYAADGHSLASLARLGYRVDSSVTPHVRWQYGTQILDFSRAPEQPYLPMPDDICTPGENTVLEVPLTIAVMHSRWLRRPRPFWLRPSMASAERMIQVIEDYRARYAQEPCLVLNMMFHSMEIIPGASPYTRTEAQAKEFLARIEQVLTYARRIGAEFVTLAQLAHYWQEKCLDAR